MRRSHNDRNTTRSERGLTLIELLISVTLLGLITSALTASFITAMRAGDNNSQRIKENNDAQIIAGFLTRDAQAAGGSNPLTGTIDSTLGVSLTDDAGCTSAGNSLVIRFKWYERLSPLTKNTRVANYFYNTTNKKMIRQTCLNGSAADTVNLADHIGTAPAAPTATCTGTCPGLPTEVQLVAYTTNTPLVAQTPHRIDLRASLRPQSQTTPTLGNSATVPLLALGNSGPCTGGSALTVGGNTTVLVNGGAFVQSSDGGGCTAMSAQGSIDYSATGGTSILAGGTCGGNQCGQATPLANYASPLPDPFADTPVPAGVCAGGSNPPLVAGRYSPGVYPNALSVTTAVIFDPGVYVMCNGVSFSAQAIATGNDVMFYLAQGGLSINGQAQLGFSAATSGTYANLLFWIAATNATTSININGGATVNTYAGAIYAPNANITLNGGAGSSVGMIVAKTITFTGGGGSTIGIAPPTITTPSTLPAWTVNLAYPTTAFVASGGYPGYTWAATGLPAGITINSGSGLLSGTPTATGTFAVAVTATDSQTNPVTRNYNIVVNAAPTITTSSLPNGGVGTAYTSSVVGTDGTTPYVWTSTPLPTGLTLNSGTGAITGTPTAVGTTNITFTLTDAVGATATRVLSITVASVPLTVTSMTVTNANGQIAASDTLAFTYNKAIAVASMCSGGSNPWAGNASNQSINGNNQVVVSINNNAGSTGNDTMTVTSTTCALRFGTIDLGSPAWVTATRTFSGSGASRSSITYNATTFTFSVTLGSASGTTASGIAAQTFVYTPNVLVTDTFGTPITIAPPYSFAAKRF